MLIVDCPLLVLYCFIVYPVTGFVVLIPHGLFISSMHVSDVVGNDAEVSSFSLFGLPEVAALNGINNYLSYCCAAF